MRILDEKNCHCSNCNANLAYTDNDIHQNAGDNFIICPRCQSRIFINYSLETYFSPPYKCEQCGSFFETPTYIGEYGGLFAKCSNCNHEELVGEGIILTIDNVEYPTHFHFTDDAVDVQNEEINERVKRTLQMLKKDQDFAFIESGDTFVVAFKEDEDYHSAQVVVAKKYKDCEVQIPEKNF